MSPTGTRQGSGSWAALWALAFLASCSEPGTGLVTQAPEPPASPAPGARHLDAAPAPAATPSPVEETVDCFLADVPLDPKALPDPGPATPAAPGVLVREVTLERRGVPMTLWIYTPDPMPSAKLPCILITPGASGLLNGKGLMPYDREEHTFYASQLYAVIAYSQDGGYEEHPTMLFPEGMRLFLAADVGIANVRAALDYAAAKLPEVDMSRIVSVGHSCAGTIAIQAAQNDPRITACVAYAPIVNLEAHTRRGLDALQGIEEVRAAQHRLSPHRNVKRLRCPTFLFVAEDDEAVRPEELDPFAEELLRTNPRAVYEKVAQGGHSYAVEEVGMPRAMTWLATLPEIRPRQDADAAVQ